MAKVFENRFLAAVRVRSGIDLAARCQPVQLPLQTVLFEDGNQPQYVHFITSGVASLVTTMLSGNDVEVGMAASEGFPETNQLLGPQNSYKRCMMQVGGSALRMPFREFREEFLRNESVRELVLRLVQFQLLAAAQLIACNSLHDLEDRLARWLLMVEDRIGTPELPLTQEFLGDMLGTRRSTVTIAAGNLQRPGIIDYRRGLIRVEQRDRLEEVSCECYAILERFRENLYR